MLDKGVISPDLSEDRRRVMLFKRTQWNFSTDQTQFPQLSKNISIYIC